MTDFIELTELWQDGHYIKVGAIIREEKWDPMSVARFCTYFERYLGNRELSILYKFL